MFVCVYVVVDCSLFDLAILYIVGVRSKYLSVDVVTVCIPNDIFTTYYDNSVILTDHCVFTCVCVSVSVDLMISSFLYLLHSSDCFM